jgi:hypothetical protein
MPIGRNSILSHQPERPCLNHCGHCQFAVDSRHERSRKLPLRQRADRAA